MLTRIDTERDKLIQVITALYGSRTNDISFTELKEATLLGFESGIEATKLDTEFQIGESVWYTSNRKVKPGIVTSYQICGVESADHREVYKRVKYVVVPSILRTTTQHTEFFVSKLGGSDIFHTKEEALDYVTKYSYPDNPTSNP